jgi:hypothetical protein
MQRALLADGRNLFVGNSSYYQKGPLMPARIAVAICAVLWLAAPAAAQTAAPPDMSGFWINQYTPDLSVVSASSRRSRNSAPNDGAPSIPRRIQRRSACRSGRHEDSRRRFRSFSSSTTR